MQIRSKQFADYKLHNILQLAAGYLILAYFLTVHLAKKIVVKTQLVSFTFSFFFCQIVDPLNNKCILAEGCLWYLSALLIIIVLIFIKKLLGKWVSTYSNSMLLSSQIVKLSGHHHKLPSAQKCSLKHSSCLCLCT